MSNEEKQVYKKLDNLTPMHIFNEREQFVIEGMIRKSLVSKVLKDKTVLVMANEF